MGLVRSKPSDTIQERNFSVGLCRLLGHSQVFKVDFIQRDGWWAERDGHQHFSDSKPWTHSTKMQIAIVLYPGFTALDVIGPYEVFKYLPDAEIRLVWHESGPVPNDRGTVIMAATHSLAETPTPDILLVPGSEANTPVAMADEHLLAWLRQADETTTVTASVCSGALVLAAAGLLKGKPATTHWFGMPYLERYAAEARSDERIVTSGKYSTAAGVSAGIDLALMLVERLAGRARAEEVQLMIEYDPHPPTNAGHMRTAPPDVARRARKEMARLAIRPVAVKAVATVAWRRLLRKIRR